MIELHDDTEYYAALVEIDKLWDAPEGTPEIERLDALVDAVVAYEAKEA